MLHKLLSSNCLYNVYLRNIGTLISGLMEHLYFMFVVMYIKQIISYILSSTRARARIYIMYALFLILKCFLANWLHVILWIIETSTWYSLEHSFANHLNNDLIENGIMIENDMEHGLANSGNSFLMTFGKFSANVFIFLILYLVF